MNTLKLLILIAQTINTLAQRIYISDCMSKSITEDFAHPRYTCGSKGGIRYYCTGERYCSEQGTCGTSPFHKMTAQKRYSSRTYKMVQEDCVLRTKGMAEEAALERSFTPAKAENEVASRKITKADAKDAALERTFTPEKAENEVAPIRVASRTFTKANAEEAALERSFAPAKAENKVVPSRELIALKKMIRKLQEAKPAAPAPAGQDNGSHPKSWTGKSYKYDSKLGGPGLAKMISHPLPKKIDTWSATRKAWYDAEAARLYAQRTFHTEELKRYEIQRDLNEKRRKIELDDSKSLKQRINELKKLDKSFKIPIVEQDTAITRVQVLRNPKNIAERQAEREFKTKQKNSLNEWKQILKNSALDAQNVRRLQVKSGGAVDAQMKNLWTDRYNKFQEQYELNFIFHKSEFLEFARDEQYLEDTRENFEDASDSMMDKSVRQQAIKRKYRTERNPIKQLINKNNKARKAAQNKKNTAERAVSSFIRQNRRTIK